MKKLHFEYNQLKERKRAQLINKIENSLKVRILGYIMESSSEIFDSDAENVIKFMQDSKFKKDEKILLFLSTPGGFIEPVMKIINILNYYSNKEFVIFIPNQAKSAGTILCLAANQIIMGLSSEIGPIDTQMIFEDIHYSARDYVDAYNHIIDDINKYDNKKQNDHVLAAYYNRLDNIDNIQLEICRKANQRVEQLATEILQKNKHYAKMKKDDQQKLVQTLIYGYIDHSDVIDYEKASNMGLNIRFLEPEDELWNNLIETYERFKQLMLENGSNKLLFERKEILYITTQDDDDDE